MRVAVLALLAVSLAGCPKTPLCHLLNDAQGRDAPPTCVFGTTIAYDAGDSFSTADGAPGSFDVPAPAEGAVDAVSRDGSVRIATAQRQIVDVGDAEGRRSTWQADVGGPIRSLAVSPGARFVAAGSTDGIARVWEAETGALVATWVHPSAIVWIGFSQDDRHLVVRLDAEPLSETELQRRNAALPRRLRSDYLPATDFHGSHSIAAWRLP